MYLQDLVISLYALLTVQSQTAQQVQLLPQSPRLEVLASQSYSLKNRYQTESVNTVFADNILLTLSYMSGTTKMGEKVDWEKVRQPNRFHFVLEPGKSFAFHDQVIKEYQDSVVQTTNAHFIWDEGFKSDGWLVGDGVCHLASFINVVAQEAGLEVTAPTRHDFATIPDVEKSFGTSIYFMPGDANLSSKQNLYVKNNTSKPIALVFEHTSDHQLNLEVDTVSAGETR